MPIQVIPNLVQGVSQQSPQQRRDSQCEAQWDCSNSASDGCIARPCGELQAVYSGKDWEGAFFGEFVYETENYLVGIDAAGNQLGINLNTGAPITMNLASGTTTGYLTAGASLPADKLRAQVAEDNMFVANREVSPAMLSTTSGAKVNEALVFCKASNYFSNYTILLQGPATLTASFITDDTTYNGTSTIIDQLSTDIDGISGYETEVYGSVMRIWRTDGAAFTINSSDDNGSDFLLTFNGEAESYGKLPAHGFNGMVLKVGGDSKTRADDFYVVWQGTPSAGRWIETVAPSTKTSLDATTMPYAWVRTAPNVFELRKQVWSTRIVGDGIKTAVDPSFIGKSVRDILYHRNRLGLVNRGGATFSKAKFPFTMFPDTVQTILDTAPVDLVVTGADGKGTNDLRFAVQAQEQLYLWAQSQQHRISHGQEGFSEKTVGSDPSSAYEFSLSVDPLPLGAFLFFTTDVGGYVSLRALQFSAAKLVGDVDMTAHVPSYIAADAAALTASETLRMLFIRSQSQKGYLYLLNYTHDGQQFIQQGINTWRIPGGDILWASVKSNVLRVLQQRPEGVAFLKFNLTLGVKDANGQYFTRLDLRQRHDELTVTFDALTNTSSFVLDYKPTGPDVMVYTSADKVDGFTRGRAFVVTDVTDYTVTVSGDLTGYEFFVGQRITAQRDDSEFFVRTDKGSEPNDYLNVNRWSVSLANSCYTRMVVRNPHLPDKEAVFQGRTLGGPSALTGTPVPTSGDVTADIGQSAKDARVSLINDTPFPSSWQNAAVDYTSTGWNGLK